MRGEGGQNRMNISLPFATQRLRRNWPWGLPLLHHDISVEVPRRRRRVMRSLFAAWHIAAAAFLANWTVILVMCDLPGKLGIETVGPPPPTLVLPQEVKREADECIALTHSGEKEGGVALCHNTESMALLAHQSSGLPT